MKKLLVVVFIGLTVPCLALGQAPTGAAAEKPKTRSEWSAVERLKPGAAIVLTVRDGGSRTVKVGTADASSLTVIKPTDPPLPRDVEQALITLGPKLPNVLDGFDATMDTLRVSRGGVFRGREKVVDLVLVVERFDRATVAQVRDPRAMVSHWKIGALIGGGAGGVLGAVTFPGYRGIMAVTWGALGFGIGAWVGSKAKDGPVIYYEASEPPAVALDDVTWRRLRTALPLSLRGADAR